MKKLSSKLVITLFFITSYINVSAQNNYSALYSFMTNLGWHLTPDNIFTSAKNDNCSDMHYYNFEAGHKYAIVAFTRTKDVKDLSLEAQDKSGGVFSKNHNMHLLPKTFNLNDCAIFMFYAEEDLNLGIRLISKKLSEEKYCAQCHYMIFNK